MALPTIDILEDTYNFLHPDKGIKNFILWESKKLSTVQKGQEDAAVAVQFSSMGTFFDRAMISKPMMRPVEDGTMVLGGFNFMPKTIAFDAFKMSYGVQEQEYISNMNRCCSQVETAWREKKLITIQKHFPLTTILSNYIINEAHILIGEKTRTILGFRINMVHCILYTPLYDQVDPANINEPTYANGADL